MSFGAVQLMPALLVFAERYPGISLDVSFSARLADLVEDGFDLAVRIGHLSDRSLITRRLSAARLVTVASPTYVETHGALQRPEELSGHRCIIDTNFRTPHIWSFRDAASGQAVQVPVAGLLPFPMARPAFLRLNGDSVLRSCPVLLPVLKYAKALCSRF